MGDREKTASRGGPRGAPGPGENSRRRIYKKSWIAGRWACLNRAAFKRMCSKWRFGGHKPALRLVSALEPPQAYKPFVGEANLRGGRGGSVEISGGRVGGAIPKNRPRTLGGRLRFLPRETTGAHVRTRVRANFPRHSDYRLSKNRPKDGPVKLRSGIPPIDDRQRSGPGPRAAFFPASLRGRGIGARSGSENQELRGKKKCVLEGFGHSTESRHCFSDSRSAGKKKMALRGGGRRFSRPSARVARGLLSTKIILWQQPLRWDF